MSPTEKFPDVHSGRAWSGHVIEDKCPCPQQPCGLVKLSEADPECPEHRMDKTLRQGHAEKDCPGPSKEDS